MKYVFDGYQALHLYHYEDKDYERNQMEKIRAETWRSELKVGDRVDAIKNHFKHISWGRATVTDISADQLVDLEFDDEISIYDKHLLLWSPDLAPLNSHSEENDWKADLKAMDECDCLDIQNKNWYASTVLSIKTVTQHNGRAYTSAEIGYRTYSEYGMKKDSFGRYDGYADQYNDWVSLTSPRVCPMYTHAKAKGFKGYKPYQEVFGDENDQPIEEGALPVFACLRPKKSKSALLIRLINIYGEEGGFAKLVALINDKRDNDPITFELLQAHLEILGKIYPYFHRDYAVKFVPKIVAAVKDYIMNAPEKLIRSVRKETIESIINRLNDLLKRTHSPEDREKEMTTMKLNFALLQIKTDFLERRIHGIKVITDMIKGLSWKHSSSSIIDEEFMLGWLRSNDIMSIVFN
jgi:hypothetical protein